eukprot:GCRY01004040.1.p1 GENE.GCRY01004040.1~~GCRY01004040.1.p1  ORF type:complete len:532 (-),score=106.18 GCRY01004040.1:678-2081(-)
MDSNSDLDDYDFDDNDLFLSDEDDFEEKKLSLTVADVRAQQNEETQNVAEILSIPMSSAEILLRHFRFDRDRLLTRYLENPEATCREAGIMTTSETKSSDCSDGAGPCPICVDAIKEESRVTLPCGHFLCHDCFVQYLTGKIQEGQSIEIICPMYKCNIKVGEDIIKQHLSSQPEILEKYFEFKTKSFIDFSHSVFWCPAPGCKLALNASSVEGDVGVCACGFRSCIKCREEAHAPASCEQVVAWRKKCKDDSETHKWIHVNTQDCPKCHSATEKNGGCNHMICRQCKYEYCWVCMGDWAGHQNYYNCNKFKGKVEDKSQEKVSLERYLHYYHRFINHEQSLKLENKLLEETDKKMKEMQKNPDCSWVQVQFLGAACAQLHQCRAVLRWTYVYAYYLPNGPEKDIFEFLQQDLEKSTEELSGILEQESSEEIDRLSCVNATRIAERKLKNLLEGVENGLIHLEPSRT